MGISWESSGMGVQFDIPFGSSTQPRKMIHLVGWFTMIMKNLQPQTGPGQNSFFSFFYHFGYHYIHHFLSFILSSSFFIISGIMFYHFFNHMFIMFFIFFICLSCFYHVSSFFASSGAKISKKWNITIFLVFFMFYHFFHFFINFLSFFIIFYHFASIPPLEAKMILKKMIKKMI